MPITIAVDAMGGDLAPGEIVAGAIEAADELGVRVLLVGLEAAITPLLPEGISGVELVPTTEVVAMRDRPASVRTKKDSSIVISAELVRDALVLELPLAPVCDRDDCVPVELPAALVVSDDGAHDGADDDTPADPRWAALATLDLSGLDLSDSK